MKNFKHWFVCLDLSKIDDILLGYIHFLSSVIEPSTISFLHVIESENLDAEMAELFPDLNNQEEFEDAIRKEITDKVSEHLGDAGFETRVITKTGRPTDQIIDLMNAMNPDLLVMGKKTGYTGEGVIAKRIIKYVPCSVLFVPETSRYSLKTILALTDFSEQSATAIKKSQALSAASDGTVTVQHIYKYPSHFFPYMPNEEEKEKLIHHIREKRSSFIKKHDISDKLPFELTLHKKGKIMDHVYDEAVKQQADLIVAGSKSDKKISSILRNDFIDKMVNYMFGVPLLILKNKERHQKFLKKLFG